MNFLRPRFSRLHQTLLSLIALFCIGYIHVATASDSTDITTTNIKYEVKVKDSIESVKQMLISALEGKNYLIINILNVSEAMQGRGINIKPLQIVEFCNLVKAYEVNRTAHDFELFAPCRVVLYEEDGKITVMVLRPSFIASLMPKDKLTKKGMESLDGFDRDMQDILTSLESGDF